MEAARAGNGCIAPVAGLDWETGMEKKEAAVVALGMFDGMHRGHMALMERCVRMAASLAAVPAVYTFSNHPQTVLRQESPRCLSGEGERRALMEAQGIRDIRMTPFTKELAALSPEAFFDALQDIWDLRAVVAGYNYSFACGGTGTPEVLRALGRLRGFDAAIVPPVLFSGEPVSSSRIRACIEKGDVRTAAAMLGRPFALSGTVVRNRQFGRTIGFPTANIEPEPGIVLPPDGVYVTEAQVGGVCYRAVTNLGSNPTVSGERFFVETHLLDFSGELYGLPLCVAFLERLRGERKFDSPEALRARIAADVETARG